MANSALHTVPESEGGRVVRRRFLAGLALASLTALVACGSGGSAPPTNNSDASTAVARVSGGLGGLAAAGQSAGGSIVRLTGQNTFDPATLTIPAGSTVNWVNDGTTAQSATFDPTLATTKGDIALPAGVTPFDSGAIAPGQTWTHSFTTPGTYKYACVPSEAAGMIGTVVVT